MRNTLKLLLLLFISSLNFNIIIRNINITVGGTQGIALVISNYLKLKPYIIILAINISMFIMSYLLLSKKTTNSIVISTFLYPVFIKVTSTIPSIINIKLYSLYLLLAGIVSGITTGYIIKLGYSTGGVNVLVLLLKKYYVVPEYISNILINVTILLGGITLFGIKSFIYSLIVLLINSFFIKIINKNVNHCQTKSVFLG